MAHKDPKDVKSMQWREFAHWLTQRGVSVDDKRGEASYRGHRVHLPDNKKREIRFGCMRDIIGRLGLE